MKVVVMLRRGVSLCLPLITLLAITGSCAAPAEVPSGEVAGEIQQVVEVEVGGLVCHYMCQSFWGEATFSNYLANQAQFKADFKQDFEQGLTQRDRPVSASDYSFSFDRASRSTVSRCDVRGAITKSGNEYRATFFWLLTPLGLDFIDDDFQESKEGLFWQGSIKGIPTTVTVKLPVIDEREYEAWEHQVGHCHAHVWWSE